MFILQLSRTLLELKVVGTLRVPLQSELKVVGTLRVPLQSEDPVYVTQLLHHTTRQNPPER